MPMTKYSDCHCEDYPCCGHYDSFEAEPEYDEAGFLPEEAWDDDAEDDDEDMEAFQDD